MPKRDDGKIHSNPQSEKFFKMLVARNGHCLWQERVLNCTMERWQMGKHAFFVQIFPEHGIDVFTNEACPSAWSDIEAWLDTLVSPHE